VKALERHVGSGERWVDLGCGSGILAIVARHCGASAVLAIDVDPQAVRVALEVVSRNDVAGAVRVVEGTETDVTPGAWDGVVTNITTSHFLRSAPGLAAGLRPGGYLIASGFLERESSVVGAALVEAGLVEIERERLEDWGGLVARKSNGQPG
jgi:ribosomal protein L11 methyltransferase